MLSIVNFSLMVTYDKEQYIELIKLLNQINDPTLKIIL